MADPNQIADLFQQTDSNPAPVLSTPDIRPLLQQQANTIVATGTGGPSFNEANPGYKTADLVLNANFRRLGLHKPFPWRSVWDWHGICAMNLGSYQERRTHIRALVNLALDELNATEPLAEVVDAGGKQDPTWKALNVRVAGLIAEMSSARDKDTWQDIGRRSREIHIDLARLIADPSLVPTGEAARKAADAKNWLDLFLAKQSGESDEKELRALVRATWELANKVTHGDIGQVDAFANAQATTLIVRAIQMLIVVDSEDLAE